MYEFILPDIGEGISEAQLVEWCVKVGDAVAEGDTVATISTDKVDVDLPSPRSGTIVELCGTAGETLAVGTVLVRLEIAGKGNAAARPAAAGSAAPPKPPTFPAASAPARAAAAVVAGPSTRKRAAELGVDLATVAGSGPGGRILRADVEAVGGFPAAAPGQGAAVSSGRDAPDPPGPPTAADPPRPPTAVVREGLSGIRAVAAEKLAHSVRTLVHATLTFDVGADGLLALMEKLRPAAERRGVRVTPTAILAKCLGAALRDHRRFNATIDEERRELLLHPQVNLSVAVATDGGLTVPVVKGVDGRALFDVAAAIGDLVRRGREGQLTVADTRDGTFTLSNTGTLERATLIAARPIINAPQTATLWISRINERPVVVAGQLAVGRVMACSLSFDHRFIDGADATRFINDVAALFETPELALAVG